MIVKAMKRCIGMNAFQEVIVVENELPILTYGTENVTGKIG